MPDAHVPDYAPILRDAKAKFTDLRVDAPALRASSHDWSFQDTDNVELARFRERFRLDEVVARADDEWHAVKLLRNWVYMQDVWGGKDVSYMVGSADAESLLLAFNAGGWMHCTFYARLTTAVLQSMGWVARKIAAGCESGVWDRTSHHGITEVWVNAPGKWVLIDSMFDTHYELDGVPLSAYELHRAAVGGRRADIRMSKGPAGAYTDDNGRAERRRIDDPSVRSTQADMYFWRYYPLKQHSFQRNGTWDRGKALLLLDDAHEGKTWFQGEKKHGGYDGMFIETRDVNEVYFDVNRVYLEPSEKSPQARLATFGVGTFTPNLSHLEIRLDDGPWVPQSTVTRLQWPLHTGANALSVRTVNRMGRRGPQTRLSVDVTAFAERS